jgi:hypothetical protein
MSHRSTLEIGARIVGWLFILGGIAFTLSGIRLLKDPSTTVEVNGVLTSDPAMKWLMIIAGVVALGLGLALIKARADGSTR